MEVRAVPSRRSLDIPLLATALAIGWLLPNHYQPWNTFHSNAWVAAALMLSAAVVLWRQGGPITISWAPVAIAALSAVPWLQWMAGILDIAGAALMPSLYLLGLAAAFAFGEWWQRSRPGEPVRLVLTGALIAAIVSFGLLLYQWFGMASEQGMFGIWVFSAPEGSRPYGNLGQPNQMASLLLWGLIGALWWFQSESKRGMQLAALAAATCVILGIALTESRSALLTLTVGVLVATVFRHPALQPKTLRALQVLYVVYLATLFNLETVGRWLGVDSQSTMYARSMGETRLTIWKAALEASWQKPWFGYGWNQANEAFLTVFPSYPKFATFYIEQAHSLPLDLVLWMGWPLAILVLAACAWWLLRVFGSIAKPCHVAACSSLAVMLVHAMLELPLHYGYFLWPFGLLAGALNANIGERARITKLSRRAAVAAVAGLAAIYSVVVHDYFRVEAAFTELRFQLARVGTGHDETLPPTLLLRDWPAFIAMSRSSPRPGMTDAEIQQWKGLLLYNTSPLAFRKVIGALVLNGRPEEARWWADRSCVVLDASLCKGLMEEWQPPANTTPR